MSREKSLKRSRNVDPHAEVEGYNSDGMVSIGEDCGILQSQTGHGARSPSPGPNKRMRLMDPDVEMFLNDVDAENRAFKALLEAEANEEFLSF